MRGVKRRWRANISGLFTCWLAMCLFLSTVFATTAHGETALPNSTQKFTGYQKNNGIGNSPDGFFTLKASAGKIEADEFGAFIDEFSGNEITSYLEVSVSGSLGSFTLDRATIGEYYSISREVTRNHFTNVYVVGYSGDDEVARTTPYDSLDQGANYEENYGINYSPFIGKKINRFRVYYTAEQGTKQQAFNLIDFTISESSIDPPPPATTTTPVVTVQIGSVSGVPGRTVTVPVSLTQATAGAGSYGMKVDFDESALEVVSATDPADDPGFDYNANNSQGSLMAAWVDVTGGDALKKAGDTLFTIKFKIKEDATLGDKALTVINQSDPTQFSFADENADEMGKTLIPGKVTVQEAVDAATPTITSQPADQTSKQGDASPSLTVGATVSDGGTLSYQWYSNTTNSTVGSTPIIGATNATYAALTTTVGTTYYYVVVTNINAQATGNQAASATSNIVAVTVSPATVPVTGVTLDHPTLSLTAGGSTGTLIATVTPANATNKNVTWSSSDTDVATVANGVVTPVGQGTATITVTTQDGGFTDTSAVTVASAPVVVPVTGVTLDHPTLSLTAGGSTATLIATVTPANATNKNVTWSSSDTDVATVANGVVTPVGQGTATITVTTQDGGYTASASITDAVCARCADECKRGCRRWTGYGQLYGTCARWRQLNHKLYSYIQP